MLGTEVQGYTTYKALYSTVTHLTFTAGSQVDKYNPTCSNEDLKTQRVTELGCKSKQDAAQFSYSFWDFLASCYFKVLLF